MRWAHTIPFVSTATFLFCLFVCFLFEKVVGREHSEKVSKNRSAVSKCSLKEIISTLFYEQRAVCTVECTLAMRKSTSLWPLWLLTSFSTMDCCSTAAVGGVFLDTCFFSFSLLLKNENANNDSPETLY